MSARPVGTLVAVAAAIATIAAVASASHAPVGDPDDARGLLDIRRVRLTHDDGPPQWLVVTFPRWSVARIWDTGHAFLFLDTRAGSGADHFVHVRSDGRRMLGSLWRTFREGGPRDRLLRSVPAWKASSRAAGVKVPLRYLDIGVRRTAFSWWVISVFGGRPCGATCLDRAPNTGTVEQWLPGHSPSPSPTGSPSPTTSPSP